MENLKQGSVFVFGTGKNRFVWYTGQRISLRVDQYAPHDFGSGIGEPENDYLA